MVLKKTRVFQAFHFLSASINLRPTRGQTFMLLAVALTHLADPDNAKSAYEQAINLDVKDPAVPLNFAVFLCNRNEIDEAKNMLNMFEVISIPHLIYLSPGFFNFLFHSCVYKNSDHLRDWTQTQT